MKIKIWQSNLLKLLMMFDTRFTPFRVQTFNGVKMREYEVTPEFMVYVNVPDEYDGKLTIKDFNFSITTHRLLIYLIEQFTKSSTTEFTITVHEFMKACGLKDRDNTKRLLEKDLFSLLCCSFDSNGSELFILENYEVGRGKFTVRLHEGFCGDLRRFKGYLYLSPEWYKIDLHGSPAAPGLLYYLVMLEHMNAKKANKNRVTVSSLLVRGKFPTAEDVRQTKNNSIKERITVPFFRNMNSLTTMCDFKYFSKTGKQYTEKELQNLTYEELTKVIVQYEIIYE